MENTIELVTIGDMRWDAVSNWAYGRSDLSGDIIRANPGISVTAIIPDGTVLQIPVKDTVDVKTSLENLPPWKQ